MRFLKSLLVTAALGCSLLLAQEKPPVDAPEQAKPVSSPVSESPLALKYDELILADGKKLKKVVIKSYDVKSEKLLMVANGKAMMLPIASIPEPLASRLKAEAPQAGSSTSSAPEKKLPPQPMVVRPAYVQPAPVTPYVPPENLEAHKHASLTRARNYYRYEFPVGSDAARVTALSFEMDEPVAITGWNNRYRTQGRALLEWFDSRGWSYKRTTSTFEVTTEKGTGSTPKVVDFAVKS